MQPFQCLASGAPALVLALCPASAGHAVHAVPAVHALTAWMPQAVAGATVHAGRKQHVPLVGCQTLVSLAVTGLLAAALAAKSSPSTPHTPQLAVGVRAAADLLLGGLRQGLH